MHLAMAITVTDAEKAIVELVRGYKNLPQKFKLAQTQCIRIDYSVLQ